MITNFGEFNLFSLESEQCVLGSLLINNSLWEKISDLLIIEDFYFKNHKIIFSVILSFININKSYDVVMVYEKLKNLINFKYLDILNYLNILVKKTPNNFYIYDYANVIHNKSILRRLFYNSKNIINEIILSQNVDVNFLLKKIELDILNINKHHNKNKNDLFSIGSILREVVTEIEDLNESNNFVSGLSTGFIELDKILSGFHNGELIIIAGRPSMGKTAFSMNIAQNISLNFNLPVIIFSMEMTRNQLALRFLSSFSLFDQHDIRTGNLTNDEILDLKTIVDKFYLLKIFIDESVMLTPIDIYIRSKKLIDDYGKLGLIIVDYLQLMNSTNYNTNRVMEISEISRTLKCVARDLNVPLIAISQLNRSLENRVNKRPLMSDLRESGAIEQDADVILFIYRDEVYNINSIGKGLTEIIISKQRNGPTGVINLTFLSKFLKFRNF